MEKLSYNTDFLLENIVMLGPNERKTFKRFVLKKI